MAFRSSQIQKNLQQHEDGILSLYVALTATPRDIDELARPRHDYEDPVGEVLRCLPEAS